MKESIHNFGWCRLSFELMKDSNLTDKDILLFSILLDCCDTDLTCAISQKEVFELSGGRISRSWFYECLNRLEQYGYLERERTGRESRYRLADIIGLKRQQRKPSQPHAAEAPAEQLEVKLKYGTFQMVELTLTAFDQLVADFGETKTLEYIKRLDAYAHEHNKHYSDSNYTIRKWIAEDTKKNQQQGMSDKEYEEMQEYMSVINQFIFE